MNPRNHGIILVFICLIVIPVLADDARGTFDHGGNNKLFIVNGDGSGQSNLTTDPYADPAVSFSLSKIPAPLFHVGFILGMIALIFAIEKKL